MNEREIFLAALDISNADERQAFVSASCSQDAGLQERVEALLKSQQEAGSFLERPVMEQVAVQPIDLSEATTKVVGGTALPGTSGKDNRSPRGQSSGTDERLRDTTAEGSSSTEIELSFLDPPQKAESLGRMGHYEILEIIGRGGMGVVLKAYDEKLQRIVAIKVMASPLATNATARKRFLREAHAAAAVSHDHVITIHAVDEFKNVPFLVMNCVAGTSLQEKLDKQGPLELKEILRIGMQTAHGLAAAHAQGLVHRDVKPANILLENGIQRVKLTDFGLARAVDDVSMTQTGMIAGTPQYMSPEQADGKGVDHRSDLFSLGSVMYAMCTGHAPFRADSTMAVLMRVCADAPRPIQELNSDIPAWLCEIIDRLHAKKPEERYQTAKEVAEVLEKRLAQVQQPGYRAETVRHAKQDAIKLSKSFLKFQATLFSNTFALLFYSGVMLGLGIFLWNFRLHPSSWLDWGVAALIAIFVIAFYFFSIRQVIRNGKALVELVKCRKRHEVATGRLHAEGNDNEFGRFAYRRTGPTEQRQGEFVKSLWLWGGGSVVAFFLIWPATAAWAEYRVSPNPWIEWTCAALAFVLVFVLFFRRKPTGAVRWVGPTVCLLWALTLSYRSTDLFESRTFPCVWKNYTGRYFARLIEEHRFVEANQMILPTVEYYPASRCTFQEENGMLQVRSWPGSIIQTRLNHPPNEVPFIPNHPYPYLFHSFYWNLTHKRKLDFSFVTTKGHVRDLQPHLMINGRSVNDDEWNDFDSLQGTWLLHKVDQSDGPQVLKVRVTFSNDKMQVLIRGHDPYEGIWHLDTTQHPKRIRAVRTEGNNLLGTINGAYDLQGDQLKIDLDPTNAMPKEWAAKFGNKKVLFELQREGTKNELDEILTLAERNRDLAREEYNAGRIPMDQYLSAQIKAIEARVNRAKAKQDRDDQEKAMVELVSVWKKQHDFAKERKQAGIIKEEDVNAVEKELLKAQAELNLLRGQGDKNK